MEALHLASASWASHSFVTRYGIPQTSQKLSDGKTVYEWSDHYGMLSVRHGIPPIFGAAVAHNQKVGQDLAKAGEDSRQ
jgi:hypothetical protein